MLTFSGGKQPAFRASEQYRPSTLPVENRLILPCWVIDPYQIFADYIPHETHSIAISCIVVRGFSCAFSPGSHPAQSTNRKLDSKRQRISRRSTHLRS